MKKELFFPVHIVLTDEDQIWSYPEGDYKLSEETGWWDDETGTIYIWWPELNSLQKTGILTHEFFEKWLVKIGIPDKYAHRAANILEKIISLGQAEIEWRSSMRRNKYDEAARLIRQAARLLEGASSTRRATPPPGMGYHFTMTKKLLEEYGYDFDEGDLEHVLARLTIWEIDRLEEALEKKDIDTVLRLVGFPLGLGLVREKVDDLTDDEDFILIGISELGEDNVSLESIVEWSEMSAHEVKMIVDRLVSKGYLSLEEDMVSLLRKGGIEKKVSVLLLKAAELLEREDSPRFSIGDRVRFKGSPVATLISGGVPVGAEGTVVEGYNGTVYMDSSKKLLAVDWDGIGLEGVDSRFVEKISSKLGSVKLAKIVKEKGKWCVKSEKGKNLGCYDTKVEAEKRLQQVEYFKHKKSGKTSYKRKAGKSWYLS